MTTQPRHPSGTPEGGQFAPGRRAAPTIRLITSPIPDDYEVNDADFPIPQANDLEKVALAVRAIRGGANTAEAVADVLDLTPREGSYYCDSAGYLGLVDKARDDDGAAVYEPTSLGNEFDNSDPHTQADTLAALVDRCPGTDAYLTGGEDALLDLYDEAGLGDETARRRASTIKSWVTQTGDHDTLALTVDQTVDGSGERIRSAAAAAYAKAVERKAAREAAELSAKPVTCPNCYMTIPLTGECDCGYVHDTAA